MKQGIKNILERTKAGAKNTGKHGLYTLAGLLSGNPAIKDYADLWAEELGPSLVSILSGNPSKGDQLYMDIANDISGGRYKGNVQAFIRENTRFDKPYKTLMMESNHGAYVLVKTVVPACLEKNKDGEDRLEKVPVYSLLFSQHTDFLDRLFLRPDDPENPITNEEIEQKLVVLRTRYEDELRRIGENGEEWIQTSWVPAAIDEHNMIKSRILENHGSAIRDEAGIIRSGSTIIWQTSSAEDDTKFDVYCYSNPVHGQSKLFITQAMLQDRLMLGFMKTLSIKLNDEPLEESEIKDFSHRKFAEISKATIRLLDPYTHKEPTDNKDKIKHLAKKINVRSIQRLAHNMRNMDGKTFSVSMGAAAALWFTLNIPVIAMSAAGKGNVLLKGGQTAFRTFGKFLSPVKTLSADQKNDISPLLASTASNNIISDEMRGLILNPAYARKMTVAPMEYMANSFPGAVPYDEEHRKKSGLNVLLDTLSIQPGAIFMYRSLRVKRSKKLEPPTSNQHITSWKCVEKKQRKFLCAEQSNGINVYYDPEQLVAFAHKARKPIPHCDLQGPINELFRMSPKGHNFIGVRHGVNGKLEDISFKSLKDLPEDFINERSRDIDDVKKNVIDIDEIGHHNELQIVNVLPENQRKKEVAKIEKELAHEISCNFDSPESEYKTGLLIQFNALFETTERNSWAISDSFNCSTDNKAVTQNHSVIRPDINENKIAIKEPGM